MPMKTPDEQRAYQREWIRERRQSWIDENGPCKQCGGSDGLEVDHVDPFTKELKPSTIWSRRKEVRDAELAKCQVLCFSCHKEKSSKDISLKQTKHPSHATINRYKQGCRCELCSEALRQHWRDRRLETSQQRERIRS